MSDQVFWDQLGLRQGAAREEIRRAYRRLARTHHPDIFPEAQKPLQELKMIALNEAYSHLMRRSRGQPAHAAEGRRPGREGGSRGAATAAAAQRGQGAGGVAAAAPTSISTPPTTGVAPHRDPSYVTYKQGFVHFSRALQGIEALYRSMKRAGVGAADPRAPVVHFKPRDDAYQRFAAGLSELRQAHEYFSRVLQDYGQSIWRRDAAVKLGRIERFSLLYRRILGNLGFRE